MNNSSASAESADKKEACALCGAATDVPQNRPIDERDCYVYGAGQLCPSCYGKLSAAEGHAAGLSGTD